MVGIRSVRMSSISQTPTATGVSGPDSSSTTGAVLGRAASEEHDDRRDRRRRSPRANRPCPQALRWDVPVEGVAGTDESNAPADEQAGALLCEAPMVSTARWVTPSAVAIRLDRRQLRAGEVGRKALLGYDPVGQRADSLDAGADRLARL